ncbi:OLC1v1007207C2 [Oldenlandia corymbosa var. corymbosa]|uniref:OLC1v1007207C2 n=1 Tax=Oldenlandia corymbosa var. corymbosa TaxID=529605 RepID=A0AAV1DLE0_OLDCO|nr:OLC1v1007207C2 [Oldenlandia corymbosa var. corymbosa]
MYSPPDESSSNMIGLEDIKKNLFKTAMRGDWTQVINIYKQHPEIHSAKITKTGDTALHIAAMDGQAGVVQELVKVIGNEGISGGHALEALATENERGNTPLHLAAALGSVPMCQCIANVDLKLIGCRNHDSETPFFLAVLHGRKDAFLCLHSICGSKQGYSFCRRNDGETILHCAIAGEYFDLAYQIIHLYEKLVNYVNEQGFSPLHILASKPSAFRSGSHSRRFNKIIYLCIFVDELVPHRFSDEHPLYQELEYLESAKYPENYQACVNFAWLVNKIFCLLALGAGKKDTGQQSDMEDPNRKKLHLFPANYNTFFEAVKFMSKAMLIVLGLGSREIVKIEERKKKHVWSNQVLDELLQRTSTYEYDDNGSHPQHLLSIKDDGSTRPYSFADGGDVFFSNYGILSPPEVDSSDDQANPDQDHKGNNAANGENTSSRGMGKKETPILIAAKNGVAEMVEKILQLFPVAIHDLNSDKKNIVLLAVENRQPHVYKLLLNMKIMKDSIFRKIDKDGNSALHLAAKLGEHRPWLIPGAALQMQWEIKWYEVL